MYGPDGNYFGTICQVLLKSIRVRATYPELAQLLDRHLHSGSQRHAIEEQGFGSLSLQVLDGGLIENTLAMTSILNQDTFGDVSFGLKCKGEM